MPTHTLRTMLEAARWAPSCFNEQPWRLIVATKDTPEDFEAALACLTEKNRRWAHRAWVLLVACARLRFEANGTVNHHAQHDLGMALAQLALQATSLEVGVHFLAGFDPERARVTFSIPEEDHVACMAAIGYRDRPEALSSDLAERERAPRTRRPQTSWVFAGTYGRAWAPREEALVEEVLEFWFGPGSESGAAPAGVAERWWKKDPAFDEEVRREFGALYEDIRAGGHEAWLTSARGRLATILILDQFPRNMFRGTPRMYESDPRSLEIALSGIDLGFDRAVPGDLRAFFYMPLMHAESRAAQEACVRLFEDFAAEVSDGPGERIRNNLGYATQHRDIVARFGRFPHRNEILDRPSTEDEVRFLEEGGPSF